MLSYRYVYRVRTFRFTTYKARGVHFDTTHTQNQNIVKCKNKPTIVEFYPFFTRIVAVPVLRSESVLEYRRRIPMPGVGFGIGIGIVTGDTFK